MKKNVLGFISSGMVLSMLLTGCGNFQQLADNVNTISGQMSTVDTAPIAEGIQGSIESVNKLTEWANSNVSETTANLAELSEDMQVFAASDITAEDIADAVMQEVAGTVMAEIIAYQERGEKVLVEAAAKTDEGIQKITDGTNTIIAVPTTADSATDAVDETFDSAMMVVDGANEIAAGATLILQEAIRSATEIIAQAEELGIESAELENLKAKLEELKNIQIFLVGQNVIDEISDLGALAKDAAVQIDDGINVDFNVEIDSKAVVENAFVQAEAVIDNANEVSINATKAIKTINDVAKTLIAGAEQLGVKSDELNSAKAYVEAYDGVDLNIKLISKDDLAALKGLVSQAAAQSAEYDIDAILSQFVK